MLTNNNNTPSSAPPPPPPPPLLPADWGKNWKPANVAEQKEATALKYSIAILLLCTSGPVAGVCTYFIISAVLSSAAVPVSSAVIAFVSASVMLSLAAYLINSHLSAINSEKKVDPGRKKSQDLQEAKELGHGNTPTSSLPVMSGTPIVPPPPPPPPSSTTVKSNDLSTAPRVTRKSRPSDAHLTDARSDLFAQIRERDVKLKHVNNKVENAKTPGNNKDGESQQDLLHELKKKVESRRKGIDGEDNVQPLSNLDSLFSQILVMIPQPRSRSSSVSSRSSEESEQDWSDNESTYSTPLNPQLDNKKRRDSSDSGHESDDNIKPKSTTPPRSTLKAEKPPISPKPVNSKTKCEASPAAQANNVDSVNSEVQKPLSLVNQNMNIDGGKAKPFQV
uniref:WH2 domain-containing protein n=1 Tax=Wolbachia endosymbiont of Oeneis ivallda TaxID=3171168 RepID=A0AAU7YKC1_9RICK